MIVHLLVAVSHDHHMVLAAATRKTVYLPDRRIHSHAVFKLAADLRPEGKGPVCRVSTFQALRRSTNLFFPANMLNMKRADIVYNPFGEMNRVIAGRVMTSSFHSSLNPYQHRRAQKHDVESRVLHHPLAGMEATLASRPGSMTGSSLAPQGWRLLQTACR